jgi:hypothetical protein
MPEGAVSLESILCTEELCRRPGRPPDYGKDNRAFMVLVSASGPMRLTACGTGLQRSIEAAVPLHGG